MLRAVLAQNKSITIFAGEAYNVEMGITNEVFPTATEEDPNCNGGSATPADIVRNGRPTSIGTGGRHQSECPADIIGIRRRVPNGSQAPEGIRRPFQTDRAMALRLAESYEVLARVDESLARLRKYRILC